MNTFLKNFLKYTIILGVMSYLLYYAFSEIKEEVLLNGESRFEFIIRIGKTGNYYLLFGSLIIHALAHFIRSERWRLLITPLGYTASSWNSFWSVINGYFVNLAIPRGGEISRPIAMKRTEGIPLETGIGTVVSERVIDLFFLVILMGSAVVFQFDRIMGILKTETESGEPSYTKYYILLGGAATIGLAFLIMYFFKRELLFSLAEKVKAFLLGLKSGFLSVFKLKSKLTFIIYSLLIWLCYYMMLYIVLLAYEDTANVTFANAITIFVVSGIAMTLPSPGGAGTYHILVSAALVQLCAVDQGRAIAFVTIFHGLQNLFLIVVGGIGTFIIDREAKKYKNAQQG